MKVKIFTEVGKDIGLGHVSRCSSLYDEIDKRGIDVEFIIFGDIKGVDFLKNKNIMVVNWMSIDYLSININNNDYCIVDSYLASKEMYDIIAQKSKKGLYIDDTQRIEYPKGIIVNPALGAENLDYPINQGIKYLLGPQYAMLRLPFINQSRNTVNNRVKEALITIGGSDMRNITPVIIDKLCRKFTDIKFNIIIGNAFSNVDKIQELKLENVKLYYNADAELMQEIMLKSDMAITAAGQTIFELLATQTPFLPIKIAKNQENNIKSIIMLCLANKVIDYKSPAFIEELIDSFNSLQDYVVRKKLINKYRTIVDGFGSKRIIQALLKNQKIKMYFRKIKEEDCEILYKWANDPIVRQNAFNPELIKYDQHIKWFKQKLTDNNSRIYIAYIDNIPIGQIRIDIYKSNGIISYSIDKSFRGLGYGTLMLQEIIDVLKNDNTVNLTKLIGKVKYENISSQKAFIKAGYEGKKLEEYLGFIKLFK